MTFFLSFLGGQHQRNHHVNLAINNPPYRVVKITRTGGQNDKNGWSAWTRIRNIQRVKKILPPKGHIGMMSVTDKQFGMMEIYRGKEETKAPPTVQQLELF